MNSAGNTSRWNQRRGARGYLYALVGTNLAIVAVAALVMVLHDRADDARWRIVTEYHMGISGQARLALTEIKLLRQSLTTMERYEAVSEPGPMLPRDIDILRLEAEDRLQIVHLASQTIEELQDRFAEARFAEATGWAVDGVTRLDGLFSSASWSNNLASGEVATAARNLDLRFEQLARLHLLAHNELIADENMGQPLDYRYLLLLFTALIVGGGVVSAVIVRRFETTTHAHGEAVTALHESDTLFKATFEQAAVGIALVTPDGYLERVNDKWCQILGYTADELAGLSFKEITHPDDLEIGVDQHKKLRAGEISTLSTEKRYIRKDGKPTWVNLTVSIVRDKSGAPQYLIAVIQDIDARKRAEEGAQRFHALFDQVSIGMLLRDFDGVLVSANGSFCEMLGYDRAELMGKKLSDLTHPDDREIGQEEHRRIARGEIDSFSMEKRYLHKDGRTVWVGSMISTVRDESGSARHTTAIVADISDRKRVEAEADQSNRYLDLFFKHSLTSFVLMDRDFNFIRVNDAYARADGKKPEDFMGMNHFDLYPSEARQLFEKIRDSREPYQAYAAPFEYPDHPERGVTYWDWTLAPILDEDSKTELMVLSLNDVTERVRAEQGLRENEELFRGAFDQAAVGILLTEADGRFKRANPKMCEILGYGEDELLGITYKDVTHPEDMESSDDVHVELSAGKVLSAPVEKRYLRKDGTTIWARTTVSYMRDEDGNHLGNIGLIEDIDDRKKAEQALVVTMHSLAEAQRIGQIGSWELELDSGKLTWSEEYFRLLGLDPETFTPTYDALLEVIHPDDRELMSARNSRVAAEAIVEPIEYRVVRSDGETRVFQSRGEAVRGADDTIERLRGTVQDITERKRAEQAVRDSETRLHAFFTEAPVGLGIVDAHRRYIGLNETLAISNGRPVEDHLGKTPAELFPKEMAKMIESVMDKTLVDGEKIANEEASATTPDGTQRAWVYSQFPLPGEDKTKGALGIIAVDVSELKQAQGELSRLNTELEDRVEERTAELHAAQEELVRSERLATLGQLTATVSHELRNPLGAMRTSMYIVEQVADTQDSRLARSIERVNRSITRCDNIIDELLDFTRIRNLEPVTTRFDSWVATVLDEQPAQSGIAVKRKLGSDNAVVSADTNRLRRAIINVYENACQAVDGPDGRRPAGNDHSVTIETRTRKNRLEIIISDTGAGIHPDTLPKIFEPLFSTKNFGVGLGLPTVKHIMEQHGGGVSVTSKPGKGARFVLWLPLAPTLVAVE